MLDRPTLIQRIEAGEHFNFLCFYGHTVTDPVTKTYFSQWYPAPMFGSKSAKPLRGEIFNFTEYSQVIPKNGKRRRNGSDSSASGADL